VNTAARTDALEPVPGVLGYAWRALGLGQKGTSKRAYNCKKWKIIYDPPIDKGLVL